ncbi:MAG: Ig-like domain-containing protein [Oscillospiraceae bacterium]|jgi:hypothetical protein|nr:Ig-like domain-containing protein [Oscillospiraceae bacterium]
MKRFKSAFGAFVAAAIIVTAVPPVFVEIKAEAAGGGLSFGEYLAEQLVKFPKEIDITDYVLENKWVKFSGDSVPNSEVGKLAQRFIDEVSGNPELFFVNIAKGFGGGVSASWYRSKGVYSFKLLDIKYHITKSEYAGMKKKLDAEVETALSAVRYAETDAEKALAVHDYLILNCGYDNEALTKKKPISHSAYGSLVNKTAVCEGYSNAYKLILNKLGVECSLVSSEKAYHMWNYVKIDGNWYHTDVTADDPLYNGKNDILGYVAHNNLLLSDAEIKKTSDLHKGGDWDVRGLPAAKSTNYDKFFWRGVESALVKSDGFWYYIQTDKSSPALQPNPNINAEIFHRLRKYNFGTNKSSTVYTISSKWLNWGVQNGWSTSVTPSIAEYNGLLYFNKTDGIYSIKPNGKSVKQAVKADTKTGYVYGMKMNGNKISYSLKKGYDVKDSVKTANVAAAKATKITLNKGSVNLSGAGKSATRKASLEPSGAGDYVYWVSSDTSVAKVSKTGKITAVKKGRCEVTAFTANGREAICEVTVK